jgi:lysophospholipid acyltransferase (LPLAT)-like uncharacterized protein
MVNDQPLQLADPPADAATESAIRSALARPVARSAPPALTFKKKLQSALGFLIGTTAIRGLGLTLRLRARYHGRDYRLAEGIAIVESFRGPAKAPLLFALTHGSCYPILYAWRGRGLCVVTSRSTDGQILARVLGGLGYKTVHGSSSRGGTRALIDLARFVQHGGDAAIAIDGPRGPAEHVKPGIILLSKITGRPIIPLAATPKRYWRFQSWDRARCPLPFSAATIIGDDPILVPPDADHEVMEQKRVELENKLRALQAEVDAHVQPKVWCLKDRQRKRK